jgi:hypothetical protein
VNEARGRQRLSNGLSDGPKDRGIVTCVKEYDVVGTPMEYGPDQEQKTEEGFNDTIKAVFLGGS